MTKARLKKDKGGHVYPREWFLEDNWDFIHTLRQNLHELWHVFHKRHMLGKHDNGAKVQCVPCSPTERGCAPVLRGA